MDLRFLDAAPSAEERAAVDEVLGPPASGWQGGDRGDADWNLTEAGHAWRSRRDELLPALHAVNDRLGWISEGALNYICQRLTVPPAEAYGVATFYSLFSLRPAPPRVVHVCTDVVCRAAGAPDVCEALTEQVGPEGEDAGGVVWHGSPCLGLCERAPAALVMEAGDPPRHAVAAPLLAPAFLGAALLLFANAFSAYATAAALVSQGSPIVPLQIRTALTSEVVLGRQNVGKAMALGMVVVVAVVMWLYALLQRRTARWLSA